MLICFLTDEIVKEGEFPTPCNSDDPLKAPGKFNYQISETYINFACKETKS